MNWASVGSSRLAFGVDGLFYIFFLRHAVASLWRATTLADTPFISGLPSISPRYSDYIYSARLCCARAPTCVSHRNPFDNEDMDVILGNLSKKQKNSHRWKILVKYLLIRCILVFIYFFQQFKSTSPYQPNRFNIHPTMLSVQCFLTILFRFNGPIRNTQFWKSSYVSQVSDHNLSQLLIQASETDMQHSYFLSFQIFRVSAYGLNLLFYFFMLVHC